MPYSSGYFLHFKWWKMTGVDASIWMCQKQFYQAPDRIKLARLAQNQTDIDWSSWMVKLFALGQPTVFDRLKGGSPALWITDMTISQSQRSGFFPQLFHDEIYPDIAGITIKTIAGSERPDANPNDIIVDIIITFCPAMADPPTPVLHRQQIPKWTEDQKQGFGRYTTGPYFTHWEKI